MTIEEAIQWFEKNPFMHKDHEPFKMAIEALKQQLKAEQDELHICDFCKYYNSNIPCGTTPSACKKADKFAKEFVAELKKLKSKDEPPCETCINYGVEFTDDDSFDTCLANECHYEPKTKPQIYDFFRNPTAEERKAVADYIDSISIPTGVNVFDLMDESQTENPCDGCEYSKPYIEYKCIHSSCKFEGEPQKDCPESCPSRDICTKSDTDCLWRGGGV